MLQNKFISQGNFLFKNRGIIPIPFIVIGGGIFYFSNSEPINIDYYLYCFLISIFGLFIRILSVGYSFRKTSGRNTKGQVADKLNTTGIYSLVRNPLYIGNYFNWLGIILLFSDPLFTFVVTIFYIIIYERIILVEELFLLNKFKIDYKNYCSNTPVIFPTFKNWIKPINSFNSLKVILNEKNGLLGITVIFFLFNVLENFKFNKELYQNNWIFYSFIFSLALYVILKLYKKLKSA